MELALITPPAVQKGISLTEQYPGVFNALITAQPVIKDFAINALVDTFWIMAYAWKNVQHKNSMWLLLGFACGKILFATVIAVRVYANHADRWITSCF